MVSKGMCLGIPGEVVAIETEGALRTGRVAFGGIEKDVCLEYTPEATLGDYVIVHVGFAISVIDEAEARRTFNYLKELGDLDALDAGGQDP